MAEGLFVVSLETPPLAKRFGSQQPWTRLGDPGNIQLPSRISTTALLESMLPNDRWRLLVTLLAANHIEGDAWARIRPVAQEQVFTHAV